MAHLHTFHILQVLMNSGTFISVPNSDAYTVYLLNSTNYALYANSQSFVCLNILGCTTTINTGWVYSYQYTSSDTYYLVITCQNPSLTCTFNLNFNLAGKLLTYLSMTYFLLTLSLINGYALGFPLTASYQKMITFLRIAGYGFGNYLSRLVISFL